MKDKFELICDNCGTVHTFEGKEAWLLHNIQESLWALRNFKHEIGDETVTAGIPWVVQFSASCCDEPDIHYMEDGHENL